MTNQRLAVPTNPARALRDLNRQALIAPQDMDDEEEADAQNNTTILQSDKPTNPQTDERQKSQLAQAAPAPPARVDGRTLRPRQNTANQTMVTSMRLAVSTLELLDDYCYRHRQRKQDVVQAALDLYFAENDQD